MAPAATAPMGHEVDADLGADAHAVTAAVHRARASGAAWAARPLADRLAVIRGLRHLLASEARGLAAPVTAPWTRSVADTLVAEVLPLADACRFLERAAARALAPRWASSWERPLWLAGVRLRILREPHGVVLVIGPANYPLFLPGVQAVQALVAGNAVLLKPGRGGAAVARALARLLACAGLPAGLFQVLPESVSSVERAVQAGIDKVVFTGSSDAGRAVLARLAPTATPAVMELSGCDAAFVRPGANLDRAARALAFGMVFHGGATCVAPRRVYVARALVEPLLERLRTALASVPAQRLDPDAAARARAFVGGALDAGARLVAGDASVPEVSTPVLLEAPAAGGLALPAVDLFAPVLVVIAVDGDDEALDLARRGSPYALGATVFGAGAGEGASATRFAERIDAGVVVIDDALVPTADPRLPFGGRRASGFGITRGREGLLEMTRVKAIAVRAGAFVPHLDRGPADADLAAAYLGAVHGRGLLGRCRSAIGVARALLRLRRQRPRLDAAPATEAKGWPLA